MDKPVEALSQSFLRTKARDLAELSASDGAPRQLVEQHDLSPTPTAISPTSTRSSSPQRDDRFDWTRPVDGSDPATDWRGVHGVEDSPHVLNPPTGWIQNTNNWPYSAAGVGQPEARRLSPLHGRRRREARADCTRCGCWRDAKDFTLERLRDAAFDSYLPAFAQLVPALLSAYDATPDARPAQGEARRADRGAARLGPPLVGELGSDLARGVLGRGAHGARVAAGRARRAGGLRLHGAWRRRRSRSSRRSPRRSDRLDARLRHLAHAVGGDQPVPAAHRRHRATVQRCGAEHSGAVHLGAMGLARVVRRADAIRGRSGCTGPAGTASSRWWSSAKTACGRER